MRIWPIYILGFAFVFSFLQFYGKAVSGEWLFTFKDFLVQISLLSDWFRVPNIDGISWTLEIELKFYVLFYILFILKCENNPKIIAGIGVLNLILQILYNDVNANMIYELSDTAYFICSNLLNASMYMTFILMGTALYQLYALKWDFKVWVVVEQILLICFLAAIPYSGLSSLGDKCIINYGVSLLLFYNMYILRDRVASNKILRFFADNSFSIYILHGVSGYILLTIFYDIGIPMYINLLIVIAIILFAAWLFHKYVEEPVGRLLKRWIVDRLIKHN